jgi:hypothetical protein
VTPDDFPIPDLLSLRGPSTRAEGRVRAPHSPKKIGDESKHGQSSILSALAVRQSGALVMPRLVDTEMGFILAAKLVGNCREGGRLAATPLGCAMNPIKTSGQLCQRPWATQGDGSPRRLLWPGTSCLRTLDISSRQRIDSGIPRIQVKLGSRFFFCGCV